MPSSLRAASARTLRKSARASVKVWNGSALNFTRNSIDCTPAGAKAAEVLSKYIIVDMYAKAVQGMPAEDAVKWAEGEVRKVYG